MKSLKSIPRLSCFVLFAITGPVLADKIHGFETAVLAPVAEGIPNAEQQMNQFIEYVETLESKHTETFVGAQYGDVFKIYFKGDAPAEVRKWVKESGLLVDIHDNLPFSMAELVEKRDQVEDILTKAGYNTHLSSLVTVPNDIVFTVGYKDGLADEEQEILKLLPDDLAKLVSIEIVGGKNEEPGMIGYVMEVSENKQKILVTSLAPSAAVWFSHKKSDLQPGQEVKVWYKVATPTHPGRSRAIRFEVVEPENADQSKVIGLALEKRMKQQDAGILYLKSIKHDKENKRWEVLFISDANEGSGPDAKPVIIAEEEL